jgi:hypothetical protein
MVHFVWFICDIGVTMIATGCYIYYLYVNDYEITA